MNSWPRRSRAGAYRAPSTGLALAVGASVAATVLVASPARAQKSRPESRYQPVAEDYDSGEERRSSLWEQTAFPHRERYAERINRALDFMKRRDSDGDNAAIEKLHEAIEMARKEPAAYWLLAQIYERNEDWPRCVKNYAAVLALDPMYRPRREYLPHNLEADYALHLGMGICQQRSGNFEAAIAHYKRILSRGVGGQSNDKQQLREQLYRQMGQSYMALGRLREAINTLESATREHLRSPLAYYSLAVAYDRDEQVAESRQALQSAFSFDHSMRALTATSTWFAPAADLYYYLGLAHEERKDIGWAVAYFRQYVHLSGDGAWSRRAREHLRDLAREPIISTESVRIDGVALDASEAVEAIMRAREPLMACMADAPGLMLEVRLTALGSPDPSERRRERSARSSNRSRESSGSQVVVRLESSGLFGESLARTTSRHGIVRESVVAGVRATELYSFSTTPETTQKVRACVESAAMKIALKRPTGGSESYRRVVFPLIAPPAGAEIDDALP